MALFPPIRITAIYIITVSLFCGCGFLKRIFFHKPPPAPPVNVQVLPAKTMDVPCYKQWVGTIEGYQNAEIRARVTGYLLKQNYIEGSYVQAGTVLFEIDPRPFEAALEQAKAQYAHSYAQAQLATVTLHRFTQLVKNNVISQQQYDVSYQSTQSAIAMASAAKASVDSAQLNLQFCTIVAPFDGIVGVVQAQIGNLVGSTAENAVLTQMSQVDPIKVVFPISEQEYIQAASHLNTSATLPLEKRSNLLEITLADGTVYHHKGKFDFANRQVEPTLGTIQITGIFPNPDHILRPGQYAKVQARVTDLKNAVVVPQAAVIQTQGTYQLALLNPDHTTSTRTVQVGPTYGPWWVITQGLQAGESVIVTGAQHLQSNTKVVSSPYPMPSVTPASKNPDSLFSSPTASP